MPFTPIQLAPPPGTRRIAGRTATGLAGAAALSLLAACGGSSGAPAAAGSSSASASASSSATLEAGASCKNSIRNESHVLGLVPGWAGRHEFNKKPTRPSASPRKTWRAAARSTEIADALKAGSGAPDVAR